jgi:hypothetical protein
MYEMVGDEQHAPLKCWTTQLAKVAMYRYLGVYTNPDADLSARTGQAWNATRSLNKIWRSDTITTPNKTFLFQTLVMPILLYGTPTYPLTERRKQRMQGTMTKMLKWVKGFHRTCKATAHMIYHGVKQITTIARERASNMIAATLEHTPLHPLLEVLKSQPTAKLRASRYCLLRDQLLGLTARLNTPMEEKTRQWEHEAYDKYRTRNNTSHLSQTVKNTLSNIAVNDDVSIANLPRYVVPQLFSVKEKATYLANAQMLDPNALDSVQAKPFLADPSHQAAHEKLTFNIVATRQNNFFWAAASCTEEPNQNRIIISRAATQTLALRAAINDLLRSFPKQRLEIHSTLPQTATPKPIGNMEDNPATDTATNGATPSTTTAENKAPPLILDERLVRKHVLFDVFKHLMQERKKHKTPTRFIHHKNNNETARQLLLPHLTTGTAYKLY